MASCIFTSMADFRERHRFHFFDRVSRVSNDIEDVLEVMNYGAKLGDKLTAEERLVLLYRYQDVTEAKMAKWKKISDIKNIGDVHFVSLAKEYLNRLEIEIIEKCHELLALIDYHLSRSKTEEDAVHYGRMKGDYYSDLAEVQTGADRKEAVSQSMKAYEAATAIDESKLRPTNPFRLPLVLNFSVFLHLIMNHTQRACNMARKASKDAVAELDHKSQQECSHIMGKIKENLALWSPYPAKNEVLRPPPPP